MPRRRVISPDAILSTIDHLTTEYGATDFCVITLKRIYEERMRPPKPKPEPTPKLPTSQRVYEAIKSGEAVTRKQMGKKLRLSEDKVSEALRRLVLDREVVGSRIVEGEREYFISRRRHDNEGLCYNTERSQKPLATTPDFSPIPFVVVHKRHG